MEECISTQDFTRAAKLKDSITELEKQRDQILQEIEERSQGADKEAHIEKVHTRRTIISVLLSELTKCSFFFFKLE